jgi:hypothetical protein
MSKPTHIVRFIANEDNRTHIGQLVDTSRDVGLDSLEGKEIKAYLINGTIFDGEVTDKVYTVKQLLSPVSMEDCNYIRCLGLNYMDHAKVSHTSPDCLNPPHPISPLAPPTNRVKTKGSKHGPPQSTNPLHETAPRPRRPVPRLHPDPQSRTRRHIGLRSRALPRDRQDRARHP